MRSKPRGGRGSNQYQTQGAAVAAVSSAAASAVVSAIHDRGDAEQRFLSAKGTTRARMNRCVTRLQAAGFAAKTYSFKKGECTCCYGGFTDEEREGTRGAVRFNLNEGANQGNDSRRASHFAKDGELKKGYYYLSWDAPDVNEIRSILESEGLAVASTSGAIKIANTTQTRALLEAGVPWEDAKLAASNGWGTAEVVPWIAAGWSYPAVVDGEWAHYGFTPDTAGPWRDVGMNGREAYDCVAAGFSPQHVKESGKEAVLVAVSFAQEVDD